MTDDPLAHRVRAALESAPVPAFPDASLAARIAATPPQAAHSFRRPLVAVGSGAALFVAALAVGVHTQFHFPPAVERAMERLERMRGHTGPFVTYDVTPQSLEQVRTQTDFPIVVPRGMRVVSAFALPKGQGVSLIIERRGRDSSGVTRDQVALDETWARGPAGKYPSVRINNDGTIHPLHTHVWRVGNVRLTVSELVPRYRAFAREIERATRPPQP